VVGVNIERSPPTDPGTHLPVPHESRRTARPVAYGRGMPGIGRPSIVQTAASTTF
jgi:hypothetical protein